LNFAAMQIDTAFHDHQTEPCARTVSHVLPAMEGAKEPLSVDFRNADPMVANGANRREIGVDLRSLGGIGGGSAGIRPTA